MNLIPIRPEVIEARRARSAGAIVLARPVPMRVAGGVAAAVLIGLAALLTFGEYTSKVRVSGQLVPAGGSIKVVAAQAGRVTAHNVKEGATVRAGQVLFELTADRIASRGSVDAQIGAAHATRRVQLQQTRDVRLLALAQRAGALADQQRLGEADIATHRGAIGTQDELIKSARDNVARYKTLARQGFVSKAQLAQHTNLLNAEQAKRAALVLNLNTAERTVLGIRQEMATIAGQRNLVSGEARSSLAVLDQEAAELDGRRAMRLVAPVAGVVTAFSYSLGQAVPAGAVLATLLPAGRELEAELLVPEHAKPSVAAGQQVYLRLGAFPYQKHGLIAGTVKQVEQSPINDGAPGGSGASVPLYRVTVALSASAVMSYGKEKQFDPGMKLEADIFNDRRSLGEWVFKPFISAAKGRTP